jgi:hypothetical protein
MLHRPFCRLIPGHDTDEVAIHAECWVCRAPDFAASGDKLLAAIIVARRRAPIFPECGRLKKRVGKLNRRLLVLASFNRYEFGSVKKRWISGKLGLAL